jgi:hypothetical protein
VPHRYSFDRLIRAHLGWIDRALLIAAVAFPLMTLAAAGVIALRVVDVGAKTGAAIVFLVVYVAPLVIAAPLWLRGRLDVPMRTHVVDAVVLALAFARFVTGLLPFSGHMLFLTYSLLARPVSPRYRWVALALLVETTVYKLWQWHDPRSWGIGLAAGLAAAAVGNAWTPPRVREMAVDA